MSYEKQQWADGDIITAEKLTHIEDGISEVGGSVQKIKLGTANGGGAVIDPTQLMVMSGGLTLSGTLYDIVGSRQIVGFEIEYTQTESQVKAFSQATSVFASWGSSATSITTESIIGMSDARKQEVTTLDVSALLHHMTAGSVSIDVYAICI